MNSQCKFAPNYDVIPMTFPLLRNLQPSLMVI